MKYLVQYSETDYQFLIDEPVPGSNEVKQLIVTMLKDHKLNGNACTVTDPDEVLIRISDGLIATSDSEVIEQSDNRVLDLAFEVLNSNFQPDFINLSEMLPEG